MSVVDYYEVLGVERGASADEIKRAYRALARRHHPDVAEDKSKAEHHFKEINEAYEVLSDPRKRAHYDRYGSAGNNGAANGAGDFGFGAGFGDIFDMFFGNARGAPTRQGPQRGADLRYDVEVTLEEAYAGVAREIVFDRPSHCDVCNGSGAKPGTLVTSCTNCGGSGVARVARQTPLGRVITQSPCARCGGEGHVVTHPCEDCNGRGLRLVETRLTVTIPPGVDDGSRIRVAQNGEAGARGGSPGDLYVYIGVQPHPIFRRDGRETFVEVPVSFPTAALGGTVDVPSLGGDLEVSIAPGTQSGTTLRLRGAGMPGVRAQQRGDHHATIRVVVPTKVNKRQRELLEAYADAGGDTVDDRSFFERVKDAFRPE